MPMKLEVKRVETICNMMVKALGMNRRGIRVQEKGQRFWGEKEPYFGSAMHSHMHALDKLLSLSGSVPQEYLGLHSLGSWNPSFISLNSSFCKLIPVPLTQVDFTCWDVGNLGIIPRRMHAPIMLAQYADLGVSCAEMCSVCCSGQALRVGSCSSQGSHHLRPTD